MEGDGHPRLFTIPGPRSSNNPSVCGGGPRISHPQPQTEPQTAQVSCAGLIQSLKTSEIGFALLNANKLEYVERRAIHSFWGHLSCWCRLT